MALSQPAVATLFPGKYELTPLYLSLYIIAILYTAFGHLSTGNLIKGQGRTDINLKLGILNTILCVILSLTLIPTYGVIGLIATTLISIIPQLIISLWWIKKHYNATVDIQSSIKIILASLISATLTYSIVIFLNLCKLDNPNPRSNNLSNILPNNSPIDRSNQQRRHKKPKRNAKSTRTTSPNP